MAQPGKRKPSLVWEFFEKLDVPTVLENVKTRTVTKLSSVTGAVSFFVVFLAVSFFGGISGGIFVVFLVFLQYRYGTETTVCHVSNTEYRYCIKIGYTAMHWYRA